MHLTDSVKPPLSGSPAIFDSNDRLSNCEPCQHEQISMYKEYPTPICVSGVGLFNGTIHHKDKRPATTPCNGKVL